MKRKPVLGLIGFSDGDPEVHEQLKDIVQKQVDVIEEELKKSGAVDVITADRLVNSVESAKEEAEKLKSRGVDGTIFSYGVFAFPNFSVVAAKNGKGPFLLGGQSESGLAGNGGYAGSRRRPASPWNRTFPGGGRFP